jgi:molybdopterin-guanine dinucleotide biosynthesis adapter protein
MKGQTPPPIVSIVGFSGSGKTTLLEKLIPELAGLGLRIGTIKHHVHGFEMDKPGKDTWRHKRAGAAVTIISSPRQIGMVMDVDHDQHPDELTYLLHDVDIVLTEGYKQGDTPKIEIFREGLREHPVCRDDPRLIGLVTDTRVDLGVPRFALDDIKGLAAFLIDRFAITPRT